MASTNILLVDCFPDFFQKTAPPAPDPATQIGTDQVLNDGPPGVFVAYFSTDNVTDMFGAVDAQIGDIETVQLQNIDTSQITVYDGTPTFTSFTPTGSLNDVIDQIGNEIDDTQASITALDSDDIAYFGAVPTNYTPSGSAITTHFTGIDAALGTLIAADATDVSFAFLASNISDHFTDHVENGGDNAGPSGLTFNISGPGGNSVYYDQGFRSTVADAGVTLTATSDNYIDIANDGIGGGNYVVTAVPIGNPAPALAGLRLWKVETDGSSVVTPTDLRVNEHLDGADILDLTVTTAKIANNAITTAKMDALIAGATVELPTITFDASGRLTTVTTDWNITTPVNGEIPVRSGGLWVNQDPIGTIVPLGSLHSTQRWDGAAWASTSFLLSTGSAVGISSSDPQEALTIGSTKNFAIEMREPQSPSALAVAGGALAADTYFYVITARDGLGETIASTEVSATVDGIGTDQIDLSWTAVKGATEYRIYQGTTTGVYTIFFTSTVTTFSDIGGAGSAGSPPTVTTAYTVRATSDIDTTYIMNNLGLGITVARAILDVEKRSVLFTGTGTASGEGVPLTGAGHRLMWIDDQGAFRAGRANSTEWDDANIGLNSAALGFNVEASGISSMAFGATITATGLNSIAMGFTANATNSNAIAIGQQMTASGLNSLTLGNNVIASGNTSFVIGAGNGPSFEIDNSTDFSLLIGFQDTIGTVRIDSDYLELIKGLKSTATVVTTASYSVLDTDTYLSDTRTATGTSAINLPALSASNDGKMLYVFDSGYNASVNAITINPNGADTVGNAASNVIECSGLGLLIRGNNATKDWEVISDVGFKENAEMHFQGNAVVTVISIVNTPVKVLGTTTNGDTSVTFTHTSGRLTYTGKIERRFQIVVSLSAELAAGTNDIVTIYAAKNGAILTKTGIRHKIATAGDVVALPLSGTTTLSDTDFIEVFIENNTATDNILVSEINVSLE